MGNVASTVTGSAMCLAGAVVVMIAKPACDYTVKLVVKNTSLIVNDQLAVLEADISNAVKLIKETRESLARVEKAIGEHKTNEPRDVEHWLALLAEGIEPRVSDTEAMVSHAIDRTSGAIDSLSKTIGSKISKVEDMMTQTMNDVAKTNEAVGKLPKTVESKISEVGSMVTQTMNDVAKANEAIGMLPKTIDETGKRYSAYLHDEHVTMFELMSAKAGI